MSFSPPPCQRRMLASLLLVAFTLAGCVSAAMSGPAASPSPTPLDPPTAVPPLAPEIPVLVPSYQETATLEAADPNSLRFVFPTPGPAPKSAWRPPLYDVPWAPGPYDHFYFLRPIGADEVNWPLANYRYGGLFPGTDNIIHTGVDIDAPFGTPVLASAAGKVVWVGWGLYYGTENPTDPYGMAVEIQHDFGYEGERLFTVYAHMSEIDVAVGQTIQVHQQLGLVGDTGRTTGPHLHFEVRRGFAGFLHTLNPELWLAPPQGWGVLVGRLTGPDGLPLYKKDVTVISVDSGTYWVVRTYGAGATNSDPYYNENLVLSDLPAGKYKILMSYAGGLLNQTVEIQPGRITYFTFGGKNLFKTSLPPTLAPTEFFFPPTRTPTPFGSH